MPVEFSKGEAGRGQHELNLTYQTALEMADTNLVFKNAVKEIAHTCGKSATFMAKPYFADAGSSCHIHSSLWTASGESLMPERGGHDDGNDHRHHADPPDLGYHQQLHVRRRRRRVEQRG